MDAVTSLYFAGLESFGEAVRRRDYPLAAQLLKATLPHLDGAMQSMRRDVGIPPSIPIIDSQGVAIAALYPDDEVDAAFDSLAESDLLGDRVAAGSVLAARSVADDIKAALAGSAPMTRAALRRQVRHTDGRLFAQILTYLIKAETVTENNAAYSLGAPEELPLHRPEGAFRMGMPPAKFSIPNLTDLPALEGKPMYEQPPAWRSEEDWTPAIEGARAHIPVGTVLGSDGPIPLTRTPKHRRIEGKPRTLVMRGATWLVSYKRPASAKKPIWTAVILDADGSESRRVGIPANITRTYSWPDRPWVSLLCDDQVVYIYRYDGELLDIITLAGNPDIASAARSIERNSEEVYWIRAFDYDPVDRSVLYSYFDRVVLAERDGTVRWAMRTPGAPEYTDTWPAGPAPDDVAKAAQELGIRRGSGIREVASWLQSNGHKKPKRERQFAFTISWGRELETRTTTKPPLHILKSAVGDLVFDPIQYARFAERGVHVSTDSGLNLAIDDQSGALARAWQTPSAFEVMTERRGAEVGLSGLWVTHCALDVVVLDGTGVADPVHTRFRHNGPRLAGSSWLALWSGSTLRVLSGPGFQVDRTYLLPRPLSAIYPERGLLRVHVGIDNFSIDIPE